MYKSIVVATDGSPTAAEAVRQAAALAKMCGSRLHLVTACRSLASLNALSAGAAGVGMAPVNTGKMADDILEETRSALEKAALDIEEVEVEICPTPGDAAQVILEIAEAQGADLIVVGNKGMTGAKRFLLGSVPNKVAHHAHCNVMIVHTC